MTYPFVQAFHDDGKAAGPRLGFTIHMAEGGGTVGFLSRRNPDGVSVHYVIEYSGRIVQMLLESHMHTSIRIGHDPSGSAIRQDDDSNGFFGHTAAVAVLGDWADVRKSSGPNNATLAVEIEGFAAMGPNDRQKDALAELVVDIRTRHGRIGLLGHRDHNIKACPGRFIPWDRLGGHGGGNEMGLHVTLPATITAGELSIAKGAEAIRVADGVHYAVPVSVGRPAIAAALTGPNSGAGYLVDLNGDELHFIRVSQPVTFTATAPPDTAACAQLVVDARAAEHELVRAAAIAAAEAL